MKIIVDTNILISHIISGKMSNVFDFLMNDNNYLVYSAKSIKEIENTLKKPKLQKVINFERIKAIYNFIDAFGVEIQTTSNVEICRDPKDNYLLALAKDSQADYLITGDNDLLVLEEFESCKIIKPSQLKL